MQHSPLPTDPTAAATLQLQRDAVVRDVLEADLEATLGDEIWAQAFLDAAIAALAGNDAGDAPAVDARDARSVRSAMLQALDARLAPRLMPTVATATERLVRLRRVGTDAVAGEAVDEVDVALGRVVVRLTEADPFTAEHCRAVSAWCGRIAERMQLGRSETILVRRAGLVHDVGKLATPSNILLAPRRLTDPEFVVMREHVTDGEAMIGDEDLLTPLRPAVRWHHERWDGDGYPDGKRGETIPLLTRIVSVADAFNAMIGRRPYRPAMSPERALAELRAGRERQFDPEVVAMMCDVVESLPYH